LDLFYDKVNEGQMLASYELNPTEIKEKEFKQKIRVKLGQSGLVELTDYTLEEAYNEVVEKKVV